MQSKNSILVHDSKDFFSAFQLSVKAKTSTAWTICESRSSSSSSLSVLQVKSKPHTGKLSLKRYMKPNVPGIHHHDLDLRLTSIYKYRLPLTPPSHQFRSLTSNSIRIPLFPTNMHIRTPTSLPLLLTSTFLLFLTSTLAATCPAAAQQVPPSYSPSLQPSTPHLPTYAQRNLATIQKIYNLTVYPSNLPIITTGSTAVPPGLFSPNATGRVVPVGNFSGFADSIEYFFALAPSPQTEDGVGIYRAEVVEFTSGCPEVAASTVYLRTGTLDVKTGDVDRSKPVSTLSQVSLMMDSQSDSGSIHLLLLIPPLFFSDRILALRQRWSGNRLPRLDPQSPSLDHRRDRNQLQQSPNSSHRSPRSVSGDPEELRGIQSTVLGSSELYRRAGEEAFWDF